MSRTIPIIRLRNNLIVSIQIELSDALLLELKENVAHEIRNDDIRGLVLEVSGVDIFDSYVACAVRDMAQIARLMGVQTLLVGLDPGMAITLVEMGMDMQGVETSLNLEAALDLLDKRATQERQEVLELATLIREFSHGELEEEDSAEVFAEHEKL